MQLMILCTFFHSGNQSDTSECTVEDLEGTEDDEESIVLEVTEKSFTPKVKPNPKVINRKTSKVEGRVLQMMKEIEKESDKRFFAFEEKRMKLESEIEERRRLKEQEHEIKMQKLFMQAMQQMMFALLGGSYPLYPLYNQSLDPCNEETNEPQY